MMNHHPQVPKGIQWVLVIVLFVLLMIIGVISYRRLVVHKPTTSELPKPVLYTNKKNNRVSDMILIAVLFILLVIVAVVFKASKENQQRKMRYQYFSLT
ncbi:hypothetical protein [Metabacillus litoralis]|uniref:hypothetical protein n=1 Tax=Metabacillus litoralis TaxID=152268 RepID=UPI000EF57BAE|nr:hypothetical protein [Metabacillus litoralis]MCM3163315.1 hypothetical protein [Metabacillus litoralis]MCM3409502.1 hypothetical protein [Metabacillus litoralis]